MCKKIPIKSITPSLAALYFINWIRVWCPIQKIIDVSIDLSFTSRYHEIIFNEANWIIFKEKTLQMEPRSIFGLTSAIHICEIWTVKKNTLFIHDLLNRLMKKYWPNHIFIRAFILFDLKLWIVLKQNKVILNAWIDTRWVRSISTPSNAKKNVSKCQKYTNWQFIAPKSIWFRRRCTTAHTRNRLKTIFLIQLKTNH